MQRNLFALLAGALFGLGLTVSGMTDTTKVQGWLDVFGDWDPTLAFVMGGAILPMAAAWTFAGRRRASVLGRPFPKPNPEGVSRELVIGSVLFGAGWALAGLCPGPAMASIGWGGTGGLIFLAAMIMGMVATPAARRGLDRLARQKGPTMDIRKLTDAYAVSPQVTPEDFAAIRAAGFTTVIDNRPDGEIPPDWHTDIMRVAAEAAGLTFVANPVIGGAMTAENVRVQGEAIAASKGPVFAYCASGNRSSQVWALSQAGKRPADEMIGVAARFGYNLEPLRPMLEAG